METYAIERRNGQEVLLPIIHPGIEVVVSRTTAGRQGTLRHLRDEEGPMFDDDGAPIVDRTTDSCSVYDSPGGGRIIWPNDAHEWEVVNGSK